MLRHGDTELEAQESNTLAELFDRLAGKNTVKDLEGIALLQCCWPRIYMQDFRAGADESTGNLTT